MQNLMGSEVQESENNLEPSPLAAQQRLRKINNRQHRACFKLSFVALGSKVTEPLTLSFLSYEMVM
jgi:hypothetical protein